MNSASALTTPLDWKSAYLATATLLTRRREALRITQDSLAATLGVGRRTFQRWEAGEIDPPAMRLFQWAAQLGVSIAPYLAHQDTGRAA